MKKFGTLVFDFDGTIADTLDAGLKIYNQMAPDYGLRPIDDNDVPLLRHMKLNDFLKHLGVPKRMVPKLLFRGTGMLKSQIGKLPVIDGMKETLHVLAKNTEHCGILTSNSVENVDLFLAHHGLQDVFSFVSSTSKLTGKAKHLRSIGRTFTTSPDHMIYIGDEIRDVKAAKKAGVTMAAVAWGFNSEESLHSSAPDYLFLHPSELIGLVD